MEKRIITVSREFGSGGRSVGKALAKRLGWKYYDKELVKAVAEKIHCPHLVLSAGTNGAEILALVRRMSLVISMRLHTLIFASGQGVPVVGIVYDPKVSGFLDYLGQDLYLPLQEVNLGALADLIDAAMAEEPFESENIQRLRRLSAENEALARRLLT